VICWGNGDCPERRGITPALLTRAFIADGLELDVGDLAIFFPTDKVEWTKPLARQATPVVFRVEKQ
jgi:hypothetical protein